MATSYEILEDDKDEEKTRLAQQLINSMDRRMTEATKRIEEVSGPITREDIESLDTNQIKEILEYVNSSTKKALNSIETPPGMDFSFRDITYRHTDDEVYLSGVSGYVRPGEMLLILGAPDSQMDTLLRVLAQRQMQGEVFGEILLNGIKPGENYRRKISYVPKIEVCRATLQVQETVHFSYRLRMDPSTPEPIVMLRVLLILKVFGLLHVRNTVVGDPVKIRGISGGERRRLTFCQEVGGFTSLLLADLPTNGLDSSTAYKLCKSVKTSCRYLDFSVIFTLAQPSPKLMNLFDNLLLMSKGRQIYFGPVSEAVEYFSTIGYQKPKIKSLPDFLQEITGDPREFYTTATDQRNRTKTISPYTSKAGTWEDLAEAWRYSDLYEELGGALWKDFPTAIAQTKSLGGLPQLEKAQMPPMSLQLKTLFKRQLLTVLRNPQFSVARVVQMCVLSLMLGLTWRDLGHDAENDVILRFSAVFTPCFNMLFLVYPYMPFFVSLREVHAFQVQSKYYWSPLFYISFQMVEIFFVLIEVFFFSCIIYSLEDLNGDTVRSSKWLYFYLMLVVVKSYGSAAVMVWISLWNGNSHKAHATFPIFMILNVATGGFLIVKSELDYPWKALMYINPLHWTFYGISLNEFWGATFNKVMQCTQEQYADPSFPQCDHAQGLDKYSISIPGHNFLSLYDCEADEDKKWEYLMLNVIIVACWHLVALLSSVWRTNELFIPSMLITEYGVTADRKGRGYSYNESETSGSLDYGYPRALDAEAGAGIGVSNKVQYRRFKKNIPRILISWKDLNYGVDLKNAETKEPYFKHILHDCFGYAEPGKLLALMGATGAGKSTLMDLLADYKTIGKQWGKVYINGIERTEGSEIHKIFHRIAGYCEQFDSHDESMTVRQAIEFSAVLRLPTNTYEEEIAERVDDVLEKLRLVPLQDKMIGSVTEGGLAPEYRKKVTIGVELVMDPGLLFLDEPTTGLDSESALNVMSCVKNLADDMSVVCTIHQPSIEVFGLFDNMMILKTGGRVCYFGGVAQMSDYFEGVGLGEWNGVQNLADFALDCSYETSDNGKDSADLFLESEQYDEALQGITKNDYGLEEPKIDFAFVPGFFKQLKLLVWRDMNRLWISRRDLTMVRLCSQLMVSTILGWLFFDLSMTQQGIETRNILCFMNLALSGLTHQQHVPFLIEQRAYVYRETKANMYKKIGLILSRQITEMPIYIIEAFCVCTPLYFMAGMKGEYYKFVLCWLCCYVATGSSIEFAISLVSTQEAADGACAAMNAININFCGFMCQYSKLPVYFRPFYWVSLVHYGFNAVGYNEYLNIGDIPPDRNGNQIFANGQGVIEYYDFDQLPWWTYIYAFLGFIFVFRILTFISFTNIEHIKR